MLDVTGARRESAGRHPRRYGTVQAVAIELAVVVLVGAAYALPLYGIAAAGLVAVVLVGAAIGRLGGHWGYQIPLAWWDIRERRRAGARAARVVEPGRAGLATLAPHLAIRGATYKNQPIGIGADEQGWFAAIALTPRDGLSRGEGGVLRLDWLAGLAAEPSMPASTLQLVIRQVAQPSPAIDPRSPAALSYQDLRAALAVPPARDLWIAVRVGVRDAVDRGGDLAGVRQALGASVTRVSAMLTAEGLDHRLLDGPGLEQAMAGAYGSELAATGESWSRWRAADGVHVCFAIRARPATPVLDLFGELAHVPAASSVCVGVGFSGSSPHAPAVTVRLTAAPAAIEGCVRHLRVTARRLGVSAVRLDGRQAPAVYATTPTAAGA